jgi:hypothetical protein
MEDLNIIYSKKKLGFVCPEGKNLFFQAGYKYTGGYYYKNYSINRLIARELRKQIVVYYNIIASGNLDIRDNKTR